MKSISDILNSMVQPADQNPLISGNQSSSSRGSNSSVGSFGDVLSRLAQKDASLSNNSSSSANNQTPTTSAPQNTGSVSFSDIQITDVQVSEKVQTDNLNPTTLKNIETTVASLAAALSQLVQLAASAQNLNPTQAQDLLVNASGGAVSATQAQQLIAQLTAFKNANGGQNALNVTPAQQNVLLIQMMQTMVQNQQVTLTSSSATQNDQTASGSSLDSTSLQFSFAGNQNGQNSGTQIETLSVNIQTLDLQQLNLDQTNAQVGQSSNLTDATTQRLTQLLQQLNVAPSATPVNIQVQSAGSTANSPDLAQNFKNLVQILTQAGAGQAVLNNFLVQNKNDQQNNAQQLFGQSTQNVQPTQPVAVTGISSTGSSNSVSISGDAQNLSDASLTLSEKSLQVSANGQNFEAQDIQLQISDVQIQSQAQALNSSAQSTVGQTQTRSLDINLQAPHAPTPILVQNTQPIDATQAAATVINVQVQQAPSSVLVQNTQPTNNATQPATPVLNIQTPVPIVVQNTQPINNAAQSQTAANTQTSQTLTSDIAQNTSVQPANNTQSVAINAQLPQGPGPVVVPTTPASAAQLSQGLGPVQSTNVPAITAQVPQGLGPVVVPTTPAITDQLSQGPGSVQPTNAPTITAQVPQDLAPVTPQNNPLPTANDQVHATTPVGIAEAPATPIYIKVPNTVTQTSTVQIQPTGDQDQVGFANGQLQLLNNIVARFNAGVVQPNGISSNTLNGTDGVHLNPEANGAVNDQATVPAVAPLQQNNVSVTAIGQSAQENSQLVQNNVQSGTTQTVLPTTQPVANTVNDSINNAFTQTGVNVTANNNNVPASAASTNSANTPTPAQNQTVAVQPVVTSNQITVPSTTTVTTPTTVQAPVVTQPVVNPASITAQNVPAATVVGEAVKAVVPVAIQANTPVINNAPVVANVSAAQAVQPVTAQAVTQTPVATEISTGLNTAANGNKDNLANTTDLQNLAAAINATATANTDKQSNSFQSTVTKISNDPNGSINSAQILNQIAQQVASQTADAKMVSRLNFQLVPESLGKVTVQVALVDQSVSARIIVSNVDVKEVLQQHMVDLKAALSQAGLQIDQMQVQVQGGGANLLAQYYQYQQEGNSYRDSAWTSDSGSEQAQSTDNSTVSAPGRSNALVNILA